MSDTETSPDGIRWVDASSSEGRKMIEKLQAESPRLADSNWSVKELIKTAEKLLEWMPIYSKGSSGNIRQTNLRAAIEKFKVEHPEPAKEKP